MRIPIKTYLFKYLKVQIGAEKFVLRRISVSEANTKELIWQQRLSKLIFPLITTGEGYKADDIKFKNYTLVGVFLSDTLINHKRAAISEKGVNLINAQLYQWFMDDMFDCLDESISNGKRMDLQILEFMNRYDLDDEDIRFDSLKKNFYRDRKTNSEKVFKKPSTTAQIVLDFGFSEKLIQK